VIDIQAKVRSAYARIAEVDRPEVWIFLRAKEDVLAEAAAIEARVARGERLALAGQLVAVKNNIDVHGIATTAGCPSYADPPSVDSDAVRLLRAAGAIVLGSTNLDQFATGLVGTRSPYGAVRNAVDPARISGGSSSGSAVAVALGIVDFALGTDTAGSGRVPAALNGIVGVKPTKGLISTVGVVPACASLDCVTVFARDLPTARRAFVAMTGAALAPGKVGPYRVGVPLDGQLGELAEGWSEAFSSATKKLAALGVEVVSIDFTPFLAAAQLLYDGAFVAERYTAVGAFIANASADLDPTVARIIRAAADIPAHRLFADQKKLAGLKVIADATLAGLDAILTPTTTQHPTLAQVSAEPIAINSSLGRFTNFANLLDYCAVAVPAGEVSGLPFGVMLTGPAHTDATIAALGELLAEPTIEIAVVGTHLTGQPLNSQLTERGGQFIRATTTAPHYRLFALDTIPPKPALVRAAEGGAAIEVEVWLLTAAHFGSFVASLPQPMAIGRLDLADGSRVSGFTCEPIAIEGRAEITQYGGWRAYLASRDARRT